MGLRVGFGFDVHQFLEGEEFWLGGVRVPFEKGAVGHSDGDVLVHAIIDALLGAACLGDIGSCFPDSDPQYKDVDSKLLLDETVEWVTREGYRVGNIDGTVMLQRPKLQGYIDPMRSAIATTVGVGIERVSVKATTTERLGFIGREEGVGAQAVVLLEG